jgi:hypothetical protein
MAFCALLVESLERPTVHFSSPFVKELVGGLVMGLRHILHCDGYVVHRKESLSIDHIVDLLSPFDDVEVVEVVKYLTSHILPRLVRDEEPVPPSFLPKYSTLFSHGWKRYLARIFANHGRVTRRQLALATSFLMVKRGLCALPKKMKLNSIKKMQAMMSQPCSTSTRLLDEVDRTASELFPLGWDSRPSPSYAPSNKSCLERTLVEGGSQSFVFSDELYWNGLETYRSACREEQIIDFQDHSLFGEKDTTLPIHPNHNVSNYEEWARRSQHEQLCCQIAQVDEPLKVRNITKNNWQCGILKPLQKMIFSQMTSERNSEVFNLTYAPVSEENMSRIKLFPGSKYVSGDYAAATDSIHSDVTETCIETILGNMTGPLSRDTALMILARKSLTGLRVYTDSTSGESFVMKRGQLMGSLLSFPLLCIINFAIWRHSTELSTGEVCDGKGRGGEADHVLINGDDIGFAATRKQYESWKSLVPGVGLKPSAGKNYFTERFLMLNSRLYVFDDDKKSLVKIDFLNLRLLRSPEEECFLSNLDSLGRMHDDFIEGGRVKGVTSGVFISSHKEMLKTSWRNLFGPRELGGLGATPVRGSVALSMEGYSVRQLVIAKLLHESKVKMYPSGLINRYDAFQKQYIKKLFPDVFGSDSPEFERLSTTYELEDVTEIVGEAKVSFLDMVSWLAPRADRPRPIYTMDHRMKTLYHESLDKRGLKQAMLPVELYLEARGEVCLYRALGKLFEGIYI